MEPHPLGVQGVIDSLDENHRATQNKGEKSQFKFAGTSPMSNPNPIRPDPIYTPEKIAEIRVAMIKYIEESKFPQISEFAYLNTIPRQTLYELPGIRDLMEKLLAKKEAILEKGGLSGQFQPTIAKFALAQRGINWTERQIIEAHNVNYDSHMTREDFEAFKANLKEFFPNVNTDDLQQEKKPDDGNDRG
jgi:hypothetical protein